MAETVLETFTRLCEARDTAAYRVVGHLDVAIYACRNGNAQEALRILSDARRIFNQADAELTNFKRSNPNHFKKENRNHGDATSQSAA